MVERHRCMCVLRYGWCVLHPEVFQLCCSSALWEFAAVKSWKSMFRKTSFLFRLVKSPRIARQEKDQVFSSFAVMQRRHTATRVLAACQTLEMCMVRVWMNVLNWNPICTPACFLGWQWRCKNVVLLLWLWCFTVIFGVLSAKFAAFSCCLQGRCARLDCYNFCTRNLFSLIFVTFLTHESEKIVSFHPSVLQRKQNLSSSGPQLSLFIVTIWLTSSIWKFSCKDSGSFLSSV